MAHVKLINDQNIERKSLNELKPGNYVQVIDESGGGPRYGEVAAVVFDIHAYEDKKLSLLKDPSESWSWSKDDRPNSDSWYYKGKFRVLPPGTKIEITI